MLKLASVFNKYTDVRDWVEGFIPLVYGKEELGLVRIKYLLKLLGNPERKFKSVHIAGTSGKGSTAFYTAKLLQGKGFKVGLHISPHLVDIRERMQIFSGQRLELRVKRKEDTLMPMSRFVRLFNEIKRVVDDIKRKQPQFTPSYFEILVGASFKYFADKKVDWAVVEVGLGGRLDATNVLMPKVSVITNIGLDHTEILGKTIEKIAKEKAGIIKPSVPVVTGVSGKAFKVIAVTAREKQSPLIKITTQYGSGGPLSRFFPQSAFLSLAAVEAAKIVVDEDLILKVFDAKFAGRLEEIGNTTSPGGLPPPPRLWRTGRGASRVILDGAHNSDKVRFLIEFVRKLKVDGIILVVAFKKGKDWRKMVDLLIKNLPVKQVVATKFYAVTDMGKHQAVEPEEIAKYIKSVYRLQTTVYSNSQEAVMEALRLTRARSGFSTHIVVTGSLYLVGEVRTMWHLPSFA